MKRGRYFFVAFIAAAITFGCLTAFVNPKYSGMSYDGYRPGFGWHHGYYNRWNPDGNNYPSPYPQPDSVYRNDRPSENLHQ